MHTAMKEIKVLFAVLAAVFALTACEDFLDKAPEENLTVDDIFAERNYAKAFLYNIYSYLPPEYDYGLGETCFSPGCDEMEEAYGAGYCHYINNGSWNPTNIGTMGIWEKSYVALRKVNMMLERMNEVPEVQPDELRWWEGELHYLRAYFHYLCFRCYGPIVIADKCWNINDDLLGIRRSPVDDCIQFMVEDLDKAIELLYDRDNWPSTDVGRATRLVAYALKARVLLYAASPLYNGNPQQADLKDPVDGTNLISQSYDVEKWKKASDAAKAALDACKAAGKGLLDTYNNPYDNYKKVYTEIGNKEVIWALNLGNGNIHWQNCADPTSFGCFAIFDPTQNQVDAYEMADGSTPITGYTNNGMVPVINKASGYTEEGFTDTASPDGYWQAGVSNMYVNREPRFYATISFAGAIWKYDKEHDYNTAYPHTLSLWADGQDGKNKAGTDYCKTGYLLRKTMNEERIPNIYSPLLQWVYFRVGELYLNYAEALNEYSGPTQEVYDAVKAIRNRAGLPGLPAGLSKEQMRDKIKHERRIELAYEHHRFFDVRRWLDAEESECKPIYSMDIYAGSHMQDPAFYRRTKVEDRVFEAPKHYLLPIPQAEIDKNRANLVQNLGWTTESTEE